MFISAPSAGSYWSFICVEGAGRLASGAQGGPGWTEKRPDPLRSSGAVLET